MKEGFDFVRGDFRSVPQSAVQHTRDPPGSGSTERPCVQKATLLLATFPVGPQLCTMNATVTPEGLSGIPGFEFTELEVASLHFHRQTIRAGHEAMAPQPHAHPSGPL